MKLILIGLIFASLTLTFMVERTIAQKEKVTRTNPSIMDVIESILKDPEFLALELKQQLNVLIIIYNMLESHYKARFGKIKSDERKSIIY